MWMFGLGLFFVSWHHWHWTLKNIIIEGNPEFCGIVLYQGSFLTERPYCPTSVADLTKTLVAKWEQIPTARFKNRVENLPRNGCPHTFGHVLCIFIRKQNDNNHKKDNILSRTQ